MASYLYNGVKLPDINEIWDKLTYPYAVIILFDGEDAGLISRHFILMSDQKLAQSTADATKCTFPNGTTVAMSILDSTGKWGEITEDTSDGSDPFNVGVGVPYIWANYDILNIDGTSILKASEPVEMPDENAYAICGTTKCKRAIYTKEQSDATFLKADKLIILEGTVSVTFNEESVGQASVSLPDNLAGDTTIILSVMVKAGSNNFSTVKANGSTVGINLFPTAYIRDSATYRDILLNFKGLYTSQTVSIPYKIALYDYS